MYLFSSLYDLIARCNWSCLLDRQMRNFYLPVRSSQAQLNIIPHILHQIQIGKQVQPVFLFHRLVVRLNKQKRGLVILLSDLYTDRVSSLESIMSTLKYFRYNGHEVIVFRLLDPQELAFDFQKPICFVDFETDQKIMVKTNNVKLSYQQRHDGFIRSFQLATKELKIDYNTIDILTPPDLALPAYLKKRKDVV